MEVKRGEEGLANNAINSSTGKIDDKGPKQ